MFSYLDVSSISERYKILRLCLVAVILLLLLVNLPFNSLRTTFAAPPVNDNPQNAIDLTGTLPTQEFADLTLATANLAPSCASNFGHTVWYEFTPTTDGTLVVDIPRYGGTEWWTVLALYTGTPNNLTEVACNTEAFWVWAQLAEPLQAGTTYHILAGTWEPNASFVVHFAYGGPPANRTVDSAVVISEGAPFTHVVDTRLSFYDGVPLSCDPRAGKNVWYQFTPSTDGTLAVDTLGTRYFFTVMGLYTGIPGNLTEVACDASKKSVSDIAWEVMANTTYYVQVGGYESRSGMLTFNALFGSPPINDLPDNATNISGQLPYRNTPDFTLASGDEVPTCAPNASHTLWYRYTPATDETLVIDMKPTDDDYWVFRAVYTGTPANLTEFACEKYATTSMNLAVDAGVTYYIQIGSIDVLYTRTIIVDFGHLPANDTFDNAIDITGNLPFSETISTAFSSYDLDSRCTWDEVGTDNTIWYKFTPATSGSLMIEVTDSNFNWVVAVYAGTPSDGDEDYCAHFGILRGGVQANTTYYIMVGSLIVTDENVYGSLTLNVSFEESPPQSFTLINPNTDTAISRFDPMPDGAVVDYAAGDVPELLNIRANVDLLGVGSVYFELTGPFNYTRTENVFPFALFGDENGDYRGYQLPPGDYTLMAFAYTQPNRQGQAAILNAIGFSVRDGNVIEPPADLEVTGFSLVNSETDREVMSLGSHTILDLADMDYRINVVAHVSDPSQTGSVYFQVTGDVYTNRLENVYPFAFLGDRSGDYHGTKLKVGFYTLTATPYTRENGGGEVGIPRIITIKVVDSRTESASVEAPIIESAATLAPDTPIIESAE